MTKDRVGDLRSYIASHIPPHQIMVLLHAKNIPDSVTRTLNTALLHYDIQQHYNSFRPALRSIYYYGNWPTLITITELNGVPTVDNNFSHQHPRWDQVRHRLLHGRY